MVSRKADALIPCGIRRSGDDVGYQLVFDEADLIADCEFHFLQAANAQRVGDPIGFQGLDRCVHVAMLLTELDELCTQHVFVC